MVLDQNYFYKHLTSLLKSDISDLTDKGGEIEDIKIGDEEFELIMNRKKLFSSGPDGPPPEGKMYDLIEAAAGDMLGAMKT